MSCISANVHTEWFRLMLSYRPSATSTLRTFQCRFRTIVDTTHRLEQRLLNIVKNLRALHLSELLPQAYFDEDPMDERDRLERCLETCVRIFESIEEHKGARSLAAYHEKLAVTISELRESVEVLDTKFIAVGPSTHCKEYGLMS